jgi:uncharacterized surface protein with fasciclin (FAS1) repeats
MRRQISLVTALVGAIALGACADGATGPAELGAAAMERRASPKPGAPAPGTDPIAAIAIGAGFDELVGALIYVDTELETGLVDLFLNGTDQYTVFAPTNEAFGELYALLSTVLGAEIDAITDVPAPVVLDVLLYHVAEGRRAAVSVVPRRNDRTITPLLGEKFWVRTDATIRDGLTGLRTDARIVTADISARNGIIHEIDQVIVPPSVVAALTGS